MLEEVLGLIPLIEIEEGYQIGVLVYCRLIEFCVEDVVTVYGVRTSQVPRGGEMVPPHLGQHLLHLSRS
jgi:hypothetical protein